MSHGINFGYYPYYVLWHPSRISGHEVTSVVTKSWIPVPKYFTDFCWQKNEIWTHTQRKIGENLQLLMMLHGCYVDWMTIN